MDYHLPVEKLQPEQRYYKIAFSFASGEDDKNREYVKKVAEILRDTHKIPKEVIFFDEWFSLAGSTIADLDLDVIYRLRSEFIVPFFCDEYTKSSWTNGVEGNAIRAVKNTYPRRVIPARLENINAIQGFNGQTSLFINSFEISEEETAKAIYSKLDLIKIPVNLLQVNKYVAEIYKNNLLKKWCEDYIIIRDIFLNYDYKNIHVKDINQYKSQWEDSSNPFNEVLLSNKNLADILDEVYKYSSQYSPKDHKILIQFLCVFCHEIQIPDHGAVKRKITQALQLLNYEDLCLVSSETITENTDFPFTNREEEIKKVLNSTISYQLITAPVSYGKATFLRKLREEFQEKGYLTFIKEVIDKKIIDDTDLCKQLEFDSTQSFIDSILADKNYKKIKDKGLVFLFITKGVHVKTIKSLKEIFIKLRDKVIKEYKCKYNKKLPDNKLKLIVSSRQLYRDSRNDTKWPYGFETIRLSEFSHLVIKKSLKKNNYFAGKNVKEEASIIAKLTLMTAGHPAIVKTVASFFKDNKSFQEEFIKDDISVLSQGFSLSIKEPKVKNLFQNKKITVYRYVNHTLLANISSKSWVNQQEIIDSLLSHGIYEKAEIRNGVETKTIKDSLLRRTCVLDYCYQQPEDFIKSSKKAQNFYFNQFKSGECTYEYSALWMTEYIYCKLQLKLLSFNYKSDQYASDIGDINNILFKDTPRLIKTLISLTSTEDLDYVEEILLTRLNHDWEFQLLLNYLPYKPDTQCYSTDAYNNLVSLIEKTFAEQQGANHD